MELPVRSYRRGLALVLCAALGCGGPAGPVHPTALVGHTKHYDPLGMRDDARVAGQAVILGTDAADGSTLLPLPAAASRVVVDAVVLGPGGAVELVAITLGAAPTAAVPVDADAKPPGVPGADAGTRDALDAGAANAGSASAGNVSGSSSTPRAAGALPAHTEAAPVIVRGLVPGGAAEMAGAARWNAGLWSAALAAATALGKDLPDVAFSAAPARAADSIAASALIAAGFLAALTGAPVDAGATLAGTVNPDGTIGPVAGLPELVLGAIARGKMRIGFPSGMRLARSEATGTPVDLVQLARAHHAEAIELATVGDAYQLLTRKLLPAAVPVDELDMALDAGALRELDAAYRAWQGRLASEWAPLLQLEQAGRLPPVIQALAQLAKLRSEQAETLHRAGKLPAAYGRLLAAWICAAGANHTHAAGAAIATGRSDAGLAALATDEPAVTALFHRIGGRRPTRLAGHLAVLAAFQAALRGWADQAFATAAAHAATELVTGLRGKPAGELGAPATRDAVAAAVAPAIVLGLRAAVEVSTADQALAAPDDGLPYAGSPHGLARLAMALQAAATAALAEVDARLTDPAARTAHVSRELARRQLAMTEPDLVLAATLAGAPSAILPPELTTWRDGSRTDDTARADAVAASLLALAGPAVALHSAGVVVARHAALAVRVDDAGKVIAIGQPEALRQLLVTSARIARAAARSARIATGAIPLTAKLAYQLAVTEATGGLDDQAAALADLWAATAASRLAVMLARN